MHFTSLLWALASNFVCMPAESFDLDFTMLQMGGPEGVRASELTSITLSCSKGMKMHAIARVKL